jgi:hypothetical protein
MTRVEATILAFFFFVILIVTFLPDRWRPVAPPVICHICECKQDATKCTSYCGSKEMCPVACASDCTKMNMAPGTKCPTQKQ